MFATRSFAQTDTLRVNIEKQAAIDANKRNGDRLKAEVQKNEDRKNEIRKTEVQINGNRLNDAENLQKENKAKDASEAAKHSKMAVQAEKKSTKS